MRKTLMQIIESGLREMGAQGLYNDIGECGCMIGDLQPCGQPCFENCEPAWNNEVRAKEEGCGFWMMPFRAENVAGGGE